MKPVFELILDLAKRTDVPKNISLPRDTVVTVAGKKFRLLDKTHVVGTPDDLAFAVNHDERSRL